MQGLKENKQHKNIQVVGKVQGVFYRDSAQKKAQELGLSGFVRNEPDGSVHIEVEGTPGAIVTFIDWCRQGPPKASVTDVTVSEGPLQSYSGFEIQ